MNERSPQLLFEFNPEHPEALPAFIIVCQDERQQAALWAKADLMLSGLRVTGGQKKT